MKIATRLLREGVATPVHEEYNPKALDLEFVDLIYSNGLQMEGSVEKYSDTLTFRGRLKSQVKHICARCLREIVNDVDRPFELVYDIKGKEEIETLDDLREILILDHPIRFLCREDCAGLCPRCGENLNEGPCRCSKVKEHG